MVGSEGRPPSFKLYIEQRLSIWTKAEHEANSIIGDLHNVARGFCLWSGKQAGRAGAVCFMAKVHSKGRGILYRIPDASGHDDVQTIGKGYSEGSVGTTSWRLC